MVQSELFATDSRAISSSVTRGACGATVCVALGQESREKNKRCLFMTWGACVGDSQPKVARGSFRGRSRRVQGKLLWIRGLSSDVPAAVQADGYLL